MKVNKKTKATHKFEENKEQFVCFFGCKKTNKLTFIVLYILLAKISFSISISPGNISPVFPAAGFALTFVLLYGYNYLISVWIASFIANTISIYNNNPFANSLIEILSSGLLVATGATIASGVSVLLIKKHNHSLYPFNSLFSTLTFITACFVSAITSALLGVLSMTLTLSKNWDHFGITFITWLKGDFIGCVILGSFLISWLYLNHFTKKSKNFTTFFSLFFLLPFLLLLYLFYIYNEPNIKYILLFGMIICFSISFGPRGVSAFTLFTLIVSTIFTNLGYGPFVIHGTNESLLLLNNLLGIGTCIGLLLAGLIIEEKKKLLFFK